ncbi:MAG: HAMP domain-containing protein [Anaerolineae bacterium]|nr:HAMP domain-containing protein [Anaerolineae bacterium]
MLPRLRWGLRARIVTWSFVPTMIVLGAVAIFTFYTYGRVTEALAIERNRKLTEFLAQQVSVELARHVDVLNALAMTPDFQSLEPAYLQTALRWSVPTLRDFDAGVAVLDAQGRVVAVDPRRPDLVGQDWSERRFFQRLGIPEEFIFASDIEDLGPDGRPVLAIVLPLQGSQQQMRGALVGLFELDPHPRSVSALYRSLLKFHTRPGESRIYLVDSARRLLDPLRLFTLGENVSTWPVAQAALTRESGALRAQGLKGEEVIASYAPIWNTPWALIEEESWRQLTAVSRRYGRLLLALLLVGLALPPVLVALGMKRIIGPVAEMTQAAQRIAGGALEQRIQAPPGDELADLASAFNEMSQRLQDLYNSLECQVAERTHELATLNGVARAVNRSLNLRETLEAALVETLAALGVRRGLIYYAWQGSERREWAGCEAPPGAQALAERAMALAQEAGQAANAPAGALAAPLLAQGAPVGAIWLWPDGEQRPDDETRALLGAIGQGVGVAAENARLYEEVERMAAAAERNRLARELHDSVTQTLFSANLIAGVLPLLWEADADEGRARLGELRELTQGALAEMRMLLLELRPAALSGAVLGDLLRQLRDAIAARARLPISLQVAGAAEPPAEVRVALYRIAQEALNNAVKHAQAQALELALEMAPGWARLTVRDDGCGFDPAQAPADRLGLRIMGERIAALGGRLRIESRSGAGTRIVAEWSASGQVDIEE